MKALYFNRELTWKDLPLPELKPAEALIKVSYAGICATDREIIKGYMSFKGILGHEFVGIVENSDEPEWIGKRVVGEINAACGKCEYCRKGLERHCPHRTVLGIKGRNGVFAEFLTLPNDNLREVPIKIDDRTAVFTEPLAAAMEIAEQVKLEPSWNALIIGDGKLAALIAQVLKLKGLKLTIAGKIQKKLQLFENWGMEITLDEPAPHSFDLVVEASGSSQGWNTAVSAVKPRGIIVLKSTYRGDLNFNPAPLVINEITLVGSRCGRFEPALRLLASNCIDIKSLISKVFAFDDMLQAFDYSLRLECMKVLVEFPQPA